MLVRLIAIVSLVLLAIAPTRATAQQVASVSLFCGSDCRFAFGAQNTIVGAVSVAMFPADAVYSGEISLAPSDYGTENQFQLVGPGCSGGFGPCLLSTLVVLNGDFPIKYHINIRVQGYNQQNSSGDVVNGTRYFGIYGVPANWTGEIF